MTISISVIIFFYHRHEYVNHIIIEFNIILLLLKLNFIINLLSKYWNQNNCESLINLNFKYLPSVSALLLVLVLK